MNKTQTFKEFLATQSPQVSVGEFMLNIVLAAALAYALGLLYVRFGRSLSNRKSFAGNFLPITMTTMLVITIVKSSLALSLGLVGALSIVRFRAAIKEPEELSYLFLAIGVGLGLGADQRVITLAAFAFIAVVVAAVGLLRGKEDDANLYLSVSIAHPAKTGLNRIVEVLKGHCAAARLYRFDAGEDSLDAVFRVEYDDFRQLEKTKEELRKLDKGVKVSFLDSSGA